MNLTFDAFPEDFFRLSIDIGEARENIEIIEETKEGKFVSIKTKIHESMSQLDAEKLFITSLKEAIEEFSKTITPSFLFDLNIRKLLVKKTMKIKDITLIYYTLFNSYEIQFLTGQLASLDHKNYELDRLEEVKVKMDKLLKTTLIKELMAQIKLQAFESINSAY